jgi:hypothetical protein
MKQRENRAVIGYLACTEQGYLFTKIVSALTRCPLFLGNRGVRCFYSRGISRIVTPEGVLGLMAVDKPLRCHVQVFCRAQQVLGSQPLGPGFPLRDSFPRHTDLARKLFLGKPEGLSLVSNTDPYRHFSEKFVSRLTNYSK